MCRLALGVLPWCPAVSGPHAKPRRLTTAHHLLRRAQALIVQFGGDAFGTRPLTLQQWAACIGFGALGLLVRRGLLYLQPRAQGHSNK